MTIGLITESSEALINMCNIKTWCLRLNLALEDVVKLSPASSDW